MQTAQLQHQTWGQAIRTRRQHQNMPAGDLAAAIGRHESTISRIETGQTALTPTNMIAIAEALGTNACDLFNLDRN